MWIFHGFHCPFLLKGRRFIGTHRTAQDVDSEAWLHAHFPFNDGVAPVRTLGSTLFLLADTKVMGEVEVDPRHRPWMPWKHLGAEVIDLLSRSPTTCGVPTATVNLTRPGNWDGPWRPVFDPIGLSDFLVMVLIGCATYKPTTMGIQPNFTGTK